MKRILPLIIQIAIIAILAVGCNEETIIGPTEYINRPSSESSELEPESAMIVNFSMVKILEFAEFFNATSIHQADKYCAYGVNNQGTTRNGITLHDIHEIDKRFPANQYGWKIPTMNEMQYIFEQSTRWKGLTERHRNASITTTKCARPQGTDYGERILRTDPQRYNFTGPKAISPLPGFMAVNRWGHSECVNDYALQNLPDDYKTYLGNPPPNWYLDDPSFNVDEAPNQEKKGAVFLRDFNRNLYHRVDVGVMCVREKWVPKTDLPYVSP